MFPDTLIEQYTVNGHTVYVKREDLCTSNEPDAPTFSKVRGLAPHLEWLASEGFDSVAYVETSVSMAGWGVSWLAPQFGLQPVIFEPQYKLDDKTLKRRPDLKVFQYHREQWNKLNAQVIPVKPGRAKVNYYIARRHIRENKLEKHWALLELGLPLKETTNETAGIAC